MPRSRRFRKNQNQTTQEWGKDNQQTKNKNRKIYIILGVVAVAAVVLSAYIALGQTPFSTPGPEPMATPLTEPAGEYSASGSRILLVTSMGNVTVQLRDDKPNTSLNFKSLVARGYYDQTIFHRVVPSFIIQGGDPSGTGYGDNMVSVIQDEIGNDNKNLRGTIAMANLGEPNTADSQFFFNLVDNTATSTYFNGAGGVLFDSAYTVFGKVIGGMNVLDNMAKVQLKQDPYTNETSRPVNDIVLIKALILS